MRVPLDNILSKKIILHSRSSKMWDFKGSSFWINELYLRIYEYIQDWFEKKLDSYFMNMNIDSIGSMLLENILYLSKEKNRRNWNYKFNQIIFSAQPSTVLEVPHIILTSTYFPLL